MVVKVEVKLTAKELFQFMMYHTYSSFSGVIGIALSVSALIGFFYTLGFEAFSNLYRLVLLLTALMFTVIQPVMLYYKSVRQIKRNSSFEKPLIYTFDTRQIEVAQEEDRVIYEWADVTKVMATKTLVLIYLGKTHAFILSKAAIGEKYQDLRTVITKSAQTVAIRMR